ncbi:MAG: hypothetical protein ACI4IX_07935 [Acutalibacteraceae bacterium]
MKRLTAITALFFAAFFCLISCQKEQADSGKAVAYINGEEISSREIEYFKTRDRADIINLYSGKYGITDYSDFWDRDFDGTTPNQALEKRAFDDACDAKIRLCLMRENGVYEDISFDALETKALAYNKEHENQKNVVGLNSIDMSQFYTYYISTGEMTLKTVLAEEKLKPTNEEIKAFTSKNGEMSEASAAAFIVDEKYEEYITDLLENAEITMAG